MIKDLFNKIKNVFGKGNEKKEDKTLSANNFTYDVIRSELSADVLQAFGSDKNTFIKSVKNICRTRCVFDEKSIILLTNESNYSITQTLFLFKKAPNIVLINSLNDYTNDSNAIFVVNKTSEWRSLCKNGLDIIQFVVPNETLENDVNFYFFGNISSKLPKMLDLYLKHKKSVIGWSSNKSHYERGKSITNVLLSSHKLNLYNGVNIDEQLFMRKLQSGNISFEDIFFVLSKTDELSNHPLMSKFGFKLSEEQKKLINQQRSIILSMTQKERNCVVTFNSSRIERIAKGSRTSIPQVETLLNMLKNLKEKSGDIAKMASDPTKLAELMKSFQPK